MPERGAAVPKAPGLFPVIRQAAGPAPPAPAVAGSGWRASPPEPALAGTGGRTALAGRPARGAPMGRKRASLARISSSLAYRSVPIARRRAVMAQPGPGRGVEVIAITPCGRRHGLPIRPCLLDSPHVRRSGVRPVEAGWRTPAPGRRAGHQGVSCPAALSQMTQRTTARRGREAPGRGPYSSRRVAESLLTADGLPAGSVPGTATSPSPRPPWRHPRPLPYVRGPCNTAAYGGGALLACGVAPGFRQGAASAPSPPYATATGTGRSRRSSTAVRRRPGG